MTGPLDPLWNLLGVLRACLTQLGNDNDERRLHEMAQACRSMAAELGPVEEHLKPVTALVGADWTTAAVVGADWSGAAALAFRAKWNTDLNPAHRTQVVKDLGSVAKVLDEAAEATRQTKDAFKQLIESVVISIGAGLAISALSAGLSAFAAWAENAEVAARTAAVGSSLLSRFTGMLGDLAAVIKACLISIGRSRALRAVTVWSPDLLTLRKAFLSTWRTYWRTYRWGWAGNLFAGAVGRAIAHQNPFNISIVGLAQMTDATVISALTGPLAATTALTEAGHPVLVAMGLGAFSGSTNALWTDRIAGKSWGQAAQDMLLYGAWSGLFTAGVTRFVPDNAVKHAWALHNADDLGLSVTNPGAKAFDQVLQQDDPGPDYAPLGSPGDPRYDGKMPLLPPESGPRQMPSPQWFSDKSPMLTSSALGFLATAGIRTIIPFAAAPPPLRMPADVTQPQPATPPPATAPSPHGGQTVTVTPWATQYSALEKIATAVYGDGELWPLIYQANRGLIGSNANLLRTGQHLRIPALVP